MSSPDARALAAAKVGMTLNGKWHLSHLLDMGGMAAVYAATHRNGRKVAVKMLSPQFAAHKEIRERFLREGYAANRVSHPGVVSILDDDIAEDGSVFLVMELLEGESLDGWIQRMGGTLPSADVLAVADQLLDILIVAHRAGIIHRDIKPGNVFITGEGQVKLLDFGLARVRDMGVSGIPTAAGIVLGTPSYLAPEQAQGKSALVDSRSDLFSVGALMFRALSGRHVHLGNSSTERLMAAMRDPAPLLRTVAQHVPRCVADVVDRALAFDKERRWQEALAMQIAVRKAYVELRTLAEGHVEGEGTAVPPSLPSEASLVVEVTFGDASSRGTDLAPKADPEAPEASVEQEKSVSVVFDLPPRTVKEKG